MQIGTEFQCEIEKTVFGGDGLARCNGEVVFLPRTLPGERLIGRVTAVKRSSNPPSWPTCSPARGSNRLPA